VDSHLFDLDFVVFVDDTVFTVCFAGQFGFMEAGIWKSYTFPLSHGICPAILSIRFKTGY
jgi:hypothetical protein